ncbi:MAG: energy transducer TonB [Desulfosalsimonas sp.]|uniref:energy transducer TonB n=1 Tax=Desulfosalsimonas sp. TaxID=3073848 RepID=UPI0039704B5B
MSGKEPDNSYFRMLFRRRRGAWAIAAAAAAVLNLAVFALVPYLLEADPEIKTYKKIASGINVIRMQEPEEPEPEAKAEEKEEQEEEPEPKKEAAAKKPAQPEKTVPFDINPRLPAGPNSMEVPEMARPKAYSPKDRFSAGELDQPLTAVSRTPPTYPMRAKRRDIEGWVKVRFVVDKQGKVGEVTILEQEPDGVFDKAVRNCVSRWRFKPGTVGGTKVKTVAETTIRFELD